jgi:hypothetical protein
MICTKAGVCRTQIRGEGPDDVRELRAHLSTTSLPYVCIEVTTDRCVRGITELTSSTHGNMRVSK